jgi:tRNA (cytidine/uridine-2'-O-)-methyltransferase
MPSIALYQPDIPQNVGAIIRLCACFGAPLHVIEPCGFVFDPAKIKRTAMDYAEHAEIKRHTSFESFLRDRPTGRLVLFSTKTDKAYDQYQFAPDDILLFGRESAGVPEDVVAAADAVLRIPMQAGLRSLNVAQTAAIGLSEALRQQRNL